MRCSPASPSRSRTRSSASTPRPDRSPFRWRCSFRSWPGSSGCSTRSACCAFRTSSRRAPWRGWPWADSGASPGPWAHGSRPLLPVGPFDPGLVEVGVHSGPDGGVEVVVAEPLVERVALEPVLHRALHLGEPQVDALGGELLVEFPED